jgi:phosphatidate cytidylyltransferase
LLLTNKNGVGLVLGMAICAVGYDLFGYFVGSQFGRTRIAPDISPNKTLEGLLAGMSAAIVLGVVVSGVFKLTPWDGKVSYGLGLGVIVAIMAPLGDLCESLIKRDLGLKDLGSILPGHGGVLDRFDAMLFCLPAVYYLARYLGIG